jgi:RimJ/RimL family protein N-acetyltransferase
MIETPRLRLLLWRETHRLPFTKMHADSLVMADQGGPISRAESDQKFARYANAWARHGIGRWAVEDQFSGFIGYAGVMFREDPDHPLGPHFEIGWRFVADAWGHGYATEAARAALADALLRVGERQILSYTTSDNVRSQGVMARLGLRRTPSLDFISDDPRIGSWRGLVWVADPKFRR